MGINIKEIRKAGPTLTELHDLFVGLRYLVKRYRETIKEENPVGVI